ncbi:MAG TPA: hypothetical protein VMP01_20885 [Pirellulaceae bacterium]|nr:hypothetical protein [Pirellulaceae bacterium]
MAAVRPSLVRFSLRTLLVLMMLICIALATTVSASPRVELVVKLVATLAIPMAVGLAAYCHDRSRAFWLGYFAFGLWLYVVMNNDGYYRNDFAGRQFREVLASIMEERLGQLHRKRLEENTRDHVVVSYNKPKIPIEQMKSQFPSHWKTKLIDEGKKIAEIASRIAWWNLQIVLALLGGAIVSAVYQLRCRNESAGINPAAR